MYTGMLAFHTECEARTRRPAAPEGGGGQDLGGKAVVITFGKTKPST